jgi:hypothetical protein
VELFQFAGPSHDRIGTTGAAAALIPRRHAVEAPLSEGPPDLPDGVIRETEFEGDVAELLAVEMAADDFLSDRHR